MTIHHRNRQQLDYALRSLCIRRACPNDEDLPAEPELWGRLARALVDAGGGGLAEALGSFDAADLGESLLIQIEQFAQGLEVGRRRSELPRLQRMRRAVREGRTNLPLDLAWDSGPVAGELI